MGLLEWALIWLVSLEGDSDTAQTEGGHSNSAAVSKLRKAQKEPNLPTSGTQRTFSFYNCEKIYFCYARHSVSGVLLWQPEKMNTPAFSTSLLFIWMAADDHLMREQWGGQKAQTMGFSLESMTSAAACWRHAGHACDRASAALHPELSRLWAINFPPSIWLCVSGYTIIVIIRCPTRWGGLAEICLESHALLSTYL